MKKILYSLLLVPLSAHAVNEYRVSSDEKIVVVTTPMGQKTLIGDEAFKNLQSYRFEMSTKDFLVPSSSGGGSGSGGGGNQNPDQPHPYANIKDTGALIDRANQLYNQGKFKESLEHVDEALRRDPKLARAWVMKGSLLHLQGNKEAAKAAWQEAQKIEPENKEIKSILEKY